MGFDPLVLGKYGFRLPGPGSPAVAPSLGGLDGFLSPAKISIGPRRPCLVYFFDPGHSSSRPTLEALGALGEDYARRLDLAALSPGTPATVASSRRGLDLGFPVLSSSGAARSLGLVSLPAFALLAPDGRVLGLREGRCELGSAGFRELVELLLAAFPAAEDGSDAGRFAPGIAIPPDTAYLAPPRAPALAGQGAWSFLGELESEVADEVNLARSDPAAYAAVLKDYRGYIHGKLLEVPGRAAIQLGEGLPAVDEAIAFLERQQPLPALFVSKGLSLSARDLAQDLGRTGATGHAASDGSTPFARMDRYGSWTGTAGENACYGPGSARAMVVSLIVDDGVPTRGHRANIFCKDFSVMGIAVAGHPEYGTVCVMDFAWAYKEK